MDKVKINNQIVAMRKFVKQAKTRVINKYTKEIKLLQNRKGNEERVLKCKRKAERLLLGVPIIRKINPDSVSKMALSKAKDWKVILNRKNVPLEDRCFAILASYGPVQMEVEKFHSANTHLITKIPTLVEEWDEKAKLPSHKLKKDKNGCKLSGANSTKIEKNPNQREVLNVKKKPEIKNSHKNNLQCNILKKPLVKEENELDINSNVSDSPSENEEEAIEEKEMIPKNDYLNANDSPEIPEVPKHKINENSNLFVPNSSSSSDEEECDNSSSELENTDENNRCKSPTKSCKTAMTSQESKLKVEAKGKNSNDPKMSSMKTNNSFKKLPRVQNKLSAESNSVKAVALLNLNEMLDMDEIPVDSKTTEETIVSGKRKKDTFFLRDDKDFSESDCDKESDDNDEKVIHSPFKKKPKRDFKTDSYEQFSTNFKGNRNNFKNKQNSRADHAQKFHSAEKNFKKGNRDFHSRGSNKFGKNPERQENNFNKNRFDKHEERQGNKFNRNMTDKNDRSDQKLFRNSSGKTFEKKMTYNKNKKDSYQRNKQENKSGKKEELPLHPSWEAKRKLKTPLKAKFQGKRTVFNN